MNHIQDIQIRWNHERKIDDDDLKFKIYQIMNQGSNIIFFSVKIVH
jgi:hypothetical protein